jgi:hypothetical protein
MVFFTFPEDARWNAERDPAEFSVLLGALSSMDAPCIASGSDEFRR